MVSVLEVIHGLVKQFKICMPTAKHYLGNLPENYKSPCFLYVVVFNSGKRQSKYIQDCTIDIQVICFNEKDGYGRSDYADKLKTMDSLKTFLDTFMLTVAGRVLKFDYNFDEADDQLTVNMTFKFKDDVINIEETYDMIEQIFINGKEV